MNRPCTYSPIRKGFKVHASRLYVRRFLNSPRHHAGAYILARVSDSSKESGSYVESVVDLEISDCRRQIVLDFPLESDSERRNSLKKARLLAETLKRFEEELESEAKVAARRERVREAARRNQRVATEWMVNVDAEGIDLDDDDMVAVHETLIPHSAAVGGSSSGLSVTMTVQAHCAGDAARIGEEILRSTLLALDMAAPTIIRANIAFVQD